jgi:hypothetical protein
MALNPRFRQDAISSLSCVWFTSASLQLEREKQNGGVGG